VPVLTDCASAAVGSKAMQKQHSATNIKTTRLLNIELPPSWAL